MSYDDEMLFDCVLQDSLQDNSIIQNMHDKINIYIYIA